MAFEPAFSRVTRAQVAQRKGSDVNPIEGRWRWWYSAIADLMIAEPHLTQKEIADRLGKHPNTVSMIVSTDMFQEFLAQRKDQWRRQHDFTILSKVTRVAELALESVAQQFEKKKDQIPLGLAVETMTSALDRLGYSPQNQQPLVQINNQQVNEGAKTVIVQGVSATVLEEARNALRLAEQKRGEETELLKQLGSPALIEVSAADGIDGASQEPDLFALLEKENGSS